MFESFISLLSRFRDSILRNLFWVALWLFLCGIGLLILRDLLGVSAIIEVNKEFVALASFISGVAVIVIFLKKTRTTFSRWIEWSRRKREHAAVRAEFEALSPIAQFFVKSVENGRELYPDRVFVRVCCLARDIPVPVEEVDALIEKGFIRQSRYGFVATAKALAALDRA